uniref:F-box domain-containing protein n=1 Tax=Strongyloides papillosus TaxID=174720 RepID=A0A0N5BMK0_STREA
MCIVSNNFVVFIDFNGLIRSKIIKTIHSFNDIGNLSKTCRLMKYYIDKEKIDRKMLCYEDFQSVGSKLKENPPESMNESDLKYIEFETTNDSNEKLSRVRQFPGDTILYKNRVVLYLNDPLEGFRENELEIFFKKLLEEVNLGDKLREDAEILELLTSFPDNEYLVLELLRYIKHDKIKVIQISLDAFVSSRDQYRRLNSDIFSGLPEFNELAIYDPSTDEDYNEIMESRETVEQVMKFLSKRKDATLDLLGLFWDYELDDFITMLIEMAKKYKIKVKYRFDSCFPCHDSRNPFFSLENFNSPLFECGWDISIIISSGEQFCNFIGNLKHFKNLEKLQIRFGLFDIKEFLTRIGKLNCPNLSLKKCKKLKSIAIESEATYMNYMEDDQYITMALENLMYLSSIMPPTIERLELSNFWRMAKETTTILSENMPNINFIVNESSLFNDPDCLTAFSNLQVYISHENNTVKIPETVKLFVLAHRSIDDNDRPMTQELIKNYFQKFSKCLHNGKDEYIFFNNVRCWNTYKKIVQESFHEQYGPYGD